MSVPSPAATIQVEILTSLAATEPVLPTVSSNWTMASSWLVPARTGRIRNSSHGRPATGSEFAASASTSAWIGVDDMTSSAATGSAAGSRRCPAPRRRAPKAGRALGRRHDRPLKRGSASTAPHNRPLHSLVAGAAAAAQARKASAAISSDRRRSGSQSMVEVEPAAGVSTGTGATSRRPAAARLDRASGGDRGGALGNCGRSLGDRGGGGGGATDGRGGARAGGRGPGVRGAGRARRARGPRGRRAELRRRSRAPDRGGAPAAGAATGGGATWRRRRRDHRRRVLPEHRGDGEGDRRGKREDRGAKVVSGVCHNGGATIEAPPRVHGSSLNLRQVVACGRRGATAARRRRLGRRGHQDPIARQSERRREGQAIFVTGGRH